jgi:branched-chain amino acid transport system substrate-binding protein
MLKKVAFLSILALSLTACGPAVVSPEADDTNDDTTVEETGPIVIGAIAPLTGDGAAYGLPVQAVANIAVEKVNEDGGINGRTLEVIWEDGKCNGADASGATQKLINVDKVQVIYGGFCSSETLGAAPLAEEAGVILISPGSSSPDITNAGDYIFRNYPSDAAQGAIDAGIAEDLGLKKIGMLTEENDYTIGIEASFIENFSGEVVSETYLPTDTDFKTQITKLKGAGIDAFFLNPQTAPKTDLMMKQLQEQGVEGLTIFGNDVVMSSAEAIGNYPELAEGMLGAMTAYNAEHPGFIHFSEKYMAENGTDEVPFVVYAATSYDLIMLLAEGIGEVGNDAEALKTWLYGVENWDGTAGSLTIDENGEPGAGHQPRVIENGSPVPYEG